MVGVACVRLPFPSPREAPIHHRSGGHRAAGAKPRALLLGYVDKVVCIWAWSSQVGCPALSSAASKAPHGRSRGCQRLAHGGALECSAGSGQHLFVPLHVTVGKVQHAQPSVFSSPPPTFRHCHSAPGPLEPLATRASLPETILCKGIRQRFLQRLRCFFNLQSSGSYRKKFFFPGIITYLLKW